MQKFAAFLGRTRNPATWSSVWNRNEEAFDTVAWIPSNDLASNCSPQMHSMPKSSRIKTWIQRVSNIIQYCLSVIWRKFPRIFNLLYIYIHIYMLYIFHCLLQQTISIALFIWVVDSHYIFQQSIFKIVFVREWR